MSTTDRNARVYAVVRQIPEGRVATYGQVAAFVERCGPRQVGTALRAVPEGAGVPWHRVINAQGEISRRGGDFLQRAMLEAEGVPFDERGRIDLKRYRWSPEAD